MVKKYKLPVWSFLLSAFILSMVQWKVAKPMLLIERFVPQAGWGMIFILAIYAAFLVHKMKDPAQSAIWRKRSWTLFSLVFFAQLVLGISGFEKFLMSPGKLHFPIPALIIGGPVYRGHISFMPILFLSTVILSGPAWCSQFCYFGAFDQLAAGKGKASAKPLAFRKPLKYSFFALVVVGALLFRAFQLGTQAASAFAALFGVAGIMVILVVSARKGKMFHCTVYCPVGTLISVIKYINPFRMKISSSCTDCMACSSSCHYDALNVKDIKNRKPGQNCTLCGDCISSCHVSAIRYKFLGLSAGQARNLWLIVTVTIHAVFLGLARL